MSRFAVEVRSERRLEQRFFVTQESTPTVDAPEGHLVSIFCGLSWAKEPETLIEPLNLADWIPELEYNA